MALTVWRGHNFSKTCWRTQSSAEQSANAKSHEEKVNYNVFAFVSALSVFVCARARIVMVNKGVMVWHSSKRSSIVWWKWKKFFFISISKHILRLPNAITAIRCACCGRFNACINRMKWKLNKIQLARRNQDYLFSLNIFIVMPNISTSFASAALQLGVVHVFVWRKKNRAIVWFDMRND